MESTVIKLRLGGLMPARTRSGDAPDLEGHRRRQPRVRHRSSDSGQRRSMSSRTVTPSCGDSRPVVAHEEIASAVRLRWQAAPRPPAGPSSGAVADAPGKERSAMTSTTTWTSSLGRRLQILSFTCESKLRMFHRERKYSP